MTFMIERKRRRAVLMSPTFRQPSSALIWSVGVTLGIAALGEVVFACINPPGKSGNGFRSGTAVYYELLPNIPEAVRSCVEDGITKWGNANNSTGGSGVTFSPVPSGVSPNLVFTMSSNIEAGTAGGISPPTRDSDGYITGVGVQFTTNTTYLESCTGFLKVTLHELGHAQNLDHTNGTNADSVMNHMHGKDDADDPPYLPTDVTPCDKNVAASEARIRRDDDYDGWSPDDDYPDADCADNDADIHPQANISCDVAQYEQQADRNCSGEPDYEELSCDPEIYNGDPLSPILVDTLGNGFSLTNTADGVLFDLNADGVKSLIPWTTPGSNDGWLVLDRNGNGLIDDGTELFGNYTPQAPSAFPNGFVALAWYDQASQGGNVDGWIDARDAIFGQLKLWLDSNHDGVSESNELFSLSHFGLLAISLDYKESRHFDRWGNQFRYRARVLSRTSRDVGPLAYDVFLAAKGKKYAAPQ